MNGEGMIRKSNRLAMAIGGLMMIPGSAWVVAWVFYESGVAWLSAGRLVPTDSPS